MNNLTLVDLFLNEYWIEKGLSENTVQSYRLDLTALCDWLDKQNLSLETLDPIRSTTISRQPFRTRLQSHEHRTNVECDAEIIPIFIS